MRDRKRVRAAVASGVLVCAAALAAHLAAAPLAAPALPHLRGIGEIRDWFNAGSGHARLILLLSPT